MATTFFDLEFYEIAPALRDPDRLYAVQSNRFGGFYAGDLEGDLQAIAGRIGTSHLLVVTFTRHGVVYDIERHRIPRLRQLPVLDAEEVNDDEFLAFMRDRFSFSPGTIQVLRFCVSDEHCGLWIDSLPWSMSQYLHSPEEYSDEEHRMNQEFIRAFAARGASCLEWNTREYWLESDGVEPGWET